MQMLLIALPAMTVGVADPERLHPVLINTGRAHTLTSFIIMIIIKAG